MALGVRKAVPDDAEAIERLRVRTWQEAYRGLISDSYLDGMAPDIDRRRALLSDSFSGDGAGVVSIVIDSAGDTGALTGWLSYGPSRDPDLTGPHDGEVYACYVAPECWRQGLGRVLMTAALDGLAAAGRSRVTLWVLSENLRARTFYARWGFRTDGASQHLDLEGPVTEVRYRLDGC